MRKRKPSANLDVRIFRVVQRIILAATVISACTSSVTFSCSLSSPSKRLRNRNRFIVTCRVAGWRNLLNELLPLPTLFTVDETSPYYLEEKKGAIFYAECWALTHYLTLKDYAAPARVASAHPRSRRRAPAFRDGSTCSTRGVIR